MRNFEGTEKWAKSEVKGEAWNEAQNELKFTAKWKASEAKPINEVDQNQQAKPVRKASDTNKIGKGPNR